MVYFMKKLIFYSMLLTVCFGSIAFNDLQDPGKWSNEKIDAWFSKKEWLNGWNVTPDASINKREFAVAYFKNKARWDKAFLFLKENDLKKLELKRFDIDGNNLYATLSEYSTKNVEEARFEGHKKYIDIQYVAAGEELIGIAPQTEITKVTTEYSSANDIGFYTVGKKLEIKATPERFFIFLPSDIHSPGIKVTENSKVRKVVVKVGID
jgi:YhcH/YjgK/YiaL family protein